MNNKLIQKHMKKALSQRVFLDVFFFSLQSKFSQVKCMSKCSPIQPVEMKGLPFHGRHAFYCKGGARCPRVVVPEM